MCVSKMYADCLNACTCVSAQYGSFNHQHLTDLYLCVCVCVCVCVANWQGGPELLTAVEWVCNVFSSLRSAG